jgi:hypothetical protein
MFFSHFLDVLLEISRGSSAVLMDVEEATKATGCLTDDEDDR